MTYRCTAGCNCASFKEHIKGVSFAAAAMPNRESSIKTVSSDNVDRQWVKDNAAYRRLKQQGLQPADVDGAARLERHATDKMEIESGKLYGEKGVKVRKEAADRGTEAGLLTAV